MAQGMSAMIKKKLKQAYARVTHNRTTAAFFVFSFILCLAQGIIQSFMFSSDFEYKGVLSDIINTVDKHILEHNLTYIPGAIHTDHLVLRLCNDVALNSQQQKNNCTTLFDTALPLLNTREPLDMEWIRFHQGQVSVKDKGTTDTVVIEQPCAQSLTFAQQEIRNFSSEDLTFVMLQFWLLVISVLAVTNDSVAHLLTVLITRALMVGWSIYSLWRSGYKKVIFRKLYADRGTLCGVDFFSGYFPSRQSYQTADLVLNVVGLLFACWLSWNLWRAYNAQATHYVGAPEHISRINKLFLAVLSCLQLEVFVLVTAMGLWIDILSNTAMRKISSHTPEYMGIFIVSSIIIIPWICLGWYSIRREMKKTILVFFFFALLIISEWSIMFYSMVYRWSFIQWPLLGCFSVASFILIIASTILALICRYNFDRGLKQYLQAEAALAEAGFSPEVFRHDEEKNTPLDLNTSDFRKSSTFSPISPNSKYETPMPTYLAAPPSAPIVPSSVNVNVNLHLNLNGAREEPQLGAQEAPNNMRVPQLAHRSQVSSHGGSRHYHIQFGESF